MKEVCLIVPRTARVFTLNEDKENITDIWIVIHGYGQLARYFLKHFEEIADENPHILIVAPEGLSRYYLDGFSGRVGASWMTKEDRGNEIIDQGAYLDRVGECFLTRFPQARLHLLGFSQGIATAWRWICNGGYDFASIVLWAGEIPQEFTPLLQKRIKDIPIFYVYGLQDELIEVHLFEKQYQQLKQPIPQLVCMTFEGGHTMDKGVLKEVCR